VTRRRSLADLGRRPIIASLLFVGLFLSAWPASSAEREPRIAIIIDDLGYLRQSGERVIALPGPVACAILPHTPYARYLAEQAHRANKEILLHLPLQPVELVMPMGVGAIDIDNTHRQLAAILDANLASVPYASGVNTHMGSLLTQHPGHMAWLMEELRQRGKLFFVDSYTTPSSVALRLARELDVPATRRHVFLDSDLDAASMAREFSRLKNYARLHGFAVAIGHPYELTLSFLERSLPLLRAEGFALVPVSSVVSRPSTTAALQD
jgi:polysaccharide deacetylase 2 family uncharacterized protein YibQ